MSKCFCGLFEKKPAIKPSKPLELKVAEPFVNELGEPTNGASEGNFKDPVDWLVDENGKRHRTNMYDQKNLIVRRAGTIKLKVAFMREFNSAGDTLRLEFSTGKAPAIQFGTMAIVDCKEDGKLDKLGWSGTLEVNDKMIEVVVNVPPTAAIGKYSVKLSLRTLLIDGSISVSSSNQPSIYIIANPMSELDGCYYENDNSEEFLDEYVFNDVGAIWPTSWSGSVNICRQYIKNGYRPVKYGQCWVFSGLLTSLLRSIGIPTRSVTNFSSAHDGDDTMTIDIYKDKDNNEVRLNRSRDSVWNFHVWNECWLQRPDFPKNMGLDGWQAVDATPQEYSNGIYQCGPAPVIAVRQGQTFLNFDTNFVYGEVNADRCTWRLNENYEIVELTERKTDGIGRFISTKAEGRNNFARRDLTDQYKFREGSKEEREAFDRAVAYAGNSRRERREFMLRNYSKIQRELLNKTRSMLKLEIVTGEFSIGDDLEIKLLVVSADNKVVELVEKPKGGVSQVIGQRALKQSSIQKRFDSSVVFSHKEYEGRLARDGQSHMRADAMIKVKNPTTGEIETHTTRHDFTLRVPPMVTIALRDQDSNPLTYPLQNASLTVEANGLFADRSFNELTLEPRTPYTLNFDFTPEKAGNFTIVVDLDSREVQNIKADATFEVLE
ncbi:Oidioi.mRNA.OKI2018_I69.PAR.g13114.t1.cds [Oikopleura dioica]|uniref:Oidioi.mRNA.OKI2018_I69.PAR.g13114.t1.cds n=1 Tax=Oikopleura dioica TaxID=34765 RepID=A0ABN7S9B7_OIKDI|nr:Oidioi.mRNA.OKI2018_I69.PAR.g13114.t1.cds [Oikopleura dioica]